MSKQSHPSFALTVQHLPLKSNHLTLQAGITDDELQAINSSRMKYGLLMNGDAGCYVDAKALHESIGKPYGDFKAWYNQVVKPYIIESESFILEVSEKGRQKIISAESLMLEKTNMEEINGLQVKPKRQDVGVKKSVYLPLEIAQDLAMMTRTPEGKEIRKYFRTVNRVFERCLKHNELRTSIESTAKHVAHVAGKASGGFDMVEAARAKKRLNHLVAKVAGSRNVPETNLGDYQKIQESVSYWLKTDLPDDIILYNSGYRDEVAA